MNVGLDTEPLLQLTLDSPSTYVVDPLYARHFTEGWAGILALFVVLSVPKIVRSIRTGRAWQGLAIKEELNNYKPLSSTASGKGSRHNPSSPSFLAKPIGALRSLVHGPSLFSIPRSQLDLGQSASIHYRWSS